jgi:hypothetical protein
MMGRNENSPKKSRHIFLSVNTFLPKSGYGFFNLPVLFLTLDTAGDCGREKKYGLTITMSSKESSPISGLGVLLQPSSCLSQMLEKDLQPECKRPGINTNKPSGIFSRSFENRINCEQNLIIFSRYLILTFAMFVRTEVEGIL